MKRIIALLLCMAAALSLFGCAGNRSSAYVPTGNALTPEDGETPTSPTEEEKGEQSLTLAYYADRSLNPYQCTDFTNRTLFSFLYQGLFSVDRDGNVEAVLCKRYTVSEDMRTYTFYPNTSATFSDGSHLTAEDVEASLLAASTSEYYKGRFSHVDSIAATQGGGVTIRLDTAYENLPLLLDIPITKASNVNSIRPLGTGPYEFASTVGGLRLHKRTQWWCEADLVVYADAIDLVAAENNAYIRDQFEFYVVGVVCADPCTDTYADYRCDYELWDCENGMFLYLGCNMYSKVFENATLRSALTYAIDREKIATEYYRGFGQPASLPLSPGSPWYNENLAEDYAYDPDKFSQAVTASGMAGKEITLLVNSDDSLRTRVANVIAEMLAAGGLKVTVVAESTKSYTESYKQGLFDLYLGQTKLSPNMDLSSFFAPWGGLSYCGMDDGAIYAMCLESLENSGNYYTLSQMVMNDGRLCPVLFGCYAIYADRGLFSNLAPARDNVFYYSIGTSASDVQYTTDVEDPTIPEETTEETTGETTEETEG